MTHSNSQTITIESVIKVYFDERKYFPNDDGVKIELNAMYWLINDLSGLLIKKYYPYAECELDLNDKDLKEFKSRTKWLRIESDNVLDYKKMLIDNRNYLDKDVLTSLKTLLEQNGKD